MLLELSDKNENEYLDNYINKEIEVLFEEQDKEFYKGHTANYIMVKLKTNMNVSNVIVNVKITGKDNLNLISSEIVTK